MLLERVALCGLAVHAAEIDRGERLREGACELLRATDKRVDRAHGRLLSASKALATVRKLLGPALPRLNPLGAPARPGAPAGTCHPLPAAG
jgi:hypothetical protein